MLNKTLVLFAHIELAVRLTVRSGITQFGWKMYGIKVPI